MMQTNTAGGSPEMASVHHGSKTCYLAMVARLLLGLVFFVFGLNGFLHFMPMPKQLPDFFIALFNTRYMIPLISGTQVVAGALLLTNLFVPLALVLLAPVIVNIIAYHIFLAPSGLPIALVVLALEIFRDDDGDESQALRRRLRFMSSAAGG